MDSETTTQQESIPASTIVIFRNGETGRPPEILMTVRSRNMVFAGGMAVFPGGRVDPQDHELARKLDLSGDLDEAAHRIAAVRETLEETGLAIGLAGEIDAIKAQAARSLLLETGALAPVLDHFGWSVDLDQLTLFARWHPKNERLPRIFDTRFYLANVGTGAVDIAADLSENTHLFWTTAQGALDASEQGDIKVIFPTRRNLERLAQFSSHEEARAQALAIPARTITPRFETRNGAPWICIDEDLGYPVTGEPIERAVRS